MRTASGITLLSFANYEGIGVHVMEVDRAASSRAKAMRKSQIFWEIMNRLVRICALFLV